MKSSHTLQQTSVEHALHASEARYRKLAELSPDGIIVCRAGKLVYINPAGLRLLGAVSPDQVVGRPFLDFVHPNDQAQMQSDSSTPPLPIFLEKLVRVDGSAVSVEISADEIEHEGAPGQLLLVRDISEKRKLELQVERIYNLSIDLMGTANSEGYFTFLNQAWQRTLGYTQQELFSIPYIDLVHPDDREATIAAAERMQEGQSAINFENRYRHKDGSYRWLAWNAVPFSREGLTYFVARDITAQKEIFEEAQERSRRLALLNEIIRIGTATLDMDELLENLGKTAARLIGGDGCHITRWDTRMQRVIPVAAHGDFHALYRELPAWGPEEKTLTAAVLERSGPLIIPDVHNSPYLSKHIAEQFTGHSVLALPLKTETDQLGALMIIYNEQHTFSVEEMIWAVQAAELISLAIARAQIHQELQARNEELDAFSHTAAHDLKSPLAVIIAYCSILEETESEVLSDKVMETLAGIKERAFLMDDMIKSLLLLASLRDPAEIITRVEMVPVVLRAQDRFEMLIKDKGVTVEIQPDLPAALSYGPWLEEVFANLIGNAIKYTGAANPAPLVSIRGTQEGAWVRYEVQDNGLGIKPEHHARLFEMFRRFHRKEAPGTGLGLSIVQRIIERLGGEVGVISAPGEGSTFWFTVPAPLD